MFDFFIGRYIRQGAQKAIDRIEPRVDVFLPKEIPLPSVTIVKRMSRVVSKINVLEKDVKPLSDEQLKAKTAEFRRRYDEMTLEMRNTWREVERDFYQAPEGEARDALALRRDKVKEELKKVKQKALDAILPEAFAVVRETSRRILNMRHFDVQLIGGMVLHEGKIAEMATGEGKTLVATLPAYLNGLTGDGVHIVTVNDYLARRDREWMGPIFEFLGLTVGVILHDMDPAERQQAYGCDITYGTNNEFGFDYLRDNMVNDKQDMVQRPHHFAIVDEVDSILIDEARTPLIISGPAEESTSTYYTAYDASRRLKGRRITEGEQIEAKYRQEDITIGFDYIADEKARSIALTETGEEKSAQLLGVSNLHDMENIEYRHHILQALKAKEFFKRDVDYVVREGEVIIVDEFTGRLMPGRRWSDGLHQAVEAKEGIKIERENQTLATITFQNYFRMYDKLSGMTGTAFTEAVEFEEIYRLECVVIPTNRRLQRQNHTDCIYKTAREKYQAVVEEINEYHTRGQPVLVGTISIEKSELLAAMLKQRGIPHQVLNAKYHELEAQIVAQAGRYQAVTIATNMAGRGTDIVLGGNAEFLAKMLAEKESKKEEGEGQAAEKEALVQKFLAQFREQVAKEHEQVVAAGGLHVIGTERHEARRIDNQLRGRSGRQGDPGSSRFFVSLEDDLMRLFASDRIISLMDRMGMEEGQVIEHPWVSGAIEVAQKRVETHNFEIRKQLLEFDNVMNKQREAIYGLRRTILESADVRQRALDALADVIYGVMHEYLFSGGNEMKWDIEGLKIYFQTKFGYDVSGREEEIRDRGYEQASELIYEDVRKIYEAKEQEMTPERLRHIEKMVFLHTIDTKWKDHLYAMDQLRGGVGLRSYAQRDPVVEFKREGFEMFQMMYASISQEIVETLFSIRSVSGPQRLRSVFGGLPQNFVHDEFSSYKTPVVPRSASGPPLARPEEPPQDRPRPIVNAGPKVGRNDPCPCGSGKKYKKCCGHSV